MTLKKIKHDDFSNEESYFVIGTKIIDTNCDILFISAKYLLSLTRGAWSLLGTVLFDGLLIGDIGEEVERFIPGHRLYLLERLATFYF